MDRLEKLVMGVGMGVLGIVLFAFASIIIAVPVYFLWNWLIPEIFGLKMITIWEAWGIAWLSGILFKTSSKNSS